MGWSSLQKALFLQPVEDVQLSLVEDGFSGVLVPLPCTSLSDCQRLSSQSELHVIINGGRYFSNVFDPIPVEPQTTRWAVDRADEREYRIVINPLLGVEEPWSQMYFDEDDKGRDRFLRNTYRRRNASWRNMFFSQPPLREVIVFHHGTGHFHVIKAKDPLRSKGLTLGDVHDNKRAFKAPIQSVWGEDGFSRGLSEDSPASEVLEKLGLNPEPESIDKSNEEEWVHRMPGDFILRQMRIKEAKLEKQPKERRVRGGNKPLGGAERTDFGRRAK